MVICKKCEKEVEKVCEKCGMCDECGCICEKEEATTEETKSEETPTEEEKSEEKAPAEEKKPPVE